MRETTPPTAAGAASAMSRTRSPYASMTAASLTRRGHRAVTLSSSKRSPRGVERLVGRLPVEQLAGLEEEPDLALGGLLGVGAVDEVVLVGDAVVAADRAGLGLEAEGRAHELARDVDRVRTLERERHDGRARHELHEALVEALALVRRVVPLGEVARDLHELH